MIHFTKKNNKTFDFVHFFTEKKTNFSRYLKYNIVFVFFRKEQFFGRKSLTVLINNKYYRTNNFTECLLSEKKKKNRWEMKDNFDKLFFEL